MLGSLNLQITSLLLGRLSGIRRYGTQVVLDFPTPNSDFRTQLTNKYFELYHSGAVQLSPELYFESTKCQKGRSQWPRDLRCGSAAVRLLELRVRIPPGAWMSVSCECCALSGRGLCDGPITRLEESY